MSRATPCWHWNKQSGRSKCKAGDRCNFLHETFKGSRVDVRDAPATATARHGQLHPQPQQQHHHHQQQQQQQQRPPQRLWQQSDLRTGVCFEFFEAGTCRYNRTCKFEHTRDPARALLPHARPPLESPHRHQQQQQQQHTGQHRRERERSPGRPRHHQQHSQQHAQQPRQVAPSQAHPQLSPSPQQRTAAPPSAAQQHQQPGPTPKHEPIPFPQQQQRPAQAQPLQQHQGQQLQRPGDPGRPPLTPGAPQQEPAPSQQLQQQPAPAGQARRATGSGYVDSVRALCAVLNIGNARAQVTEEAMHKAVRRFQLQVAFGDTPFSDSVLEWLPPRMEQAV